MVQRLLAAWVTGFGVLLAVGGCADKTLAPNKFVSPGLAKGAVEPLPLGLAPGAGGAVAPELNPFDPIALNNLAVSEVSKGNYAQALALLQRAARLAPARPDIALNVSNLERWMSLAEGQAALGLTPKPIQVARPDTAVPELPPLWSRPATPPAAPTASPPSGGGLPGRAATVPPVRGI